MPVVFLLGEPVRAGLLDGPDQPVISPLAVPGLAGLALVTGIAALIFSQLSVLVDIASIDLNSLTAELLAVVEETMQPAQVSLWLGPSTTSAQGRRRTDPARVDGQPAMAEEDRVVVLPDPRLDRVASQR